MMMVPSSWMSICVPVSLVIAWIVEPPLPITSRILSGWILIVIRRGANSLSSGAARSIALGHLAEDVQAAVPWPAPAPTFMISSVMPSILMSICSADTPFGGTGDLEVHVAEVIFVAEDVGQHDEVVAFLDQAHRDTRDRRLDRHAGIHQRQRGAADRSHRRGTVRLGDFRDDADGVRERFHRRHHGQHAALGEAAVADFATLRAHHAAGFAHRVRREVVVEQEVVLVLARDGVDDLAVARGAERDGDDRLRLAAGEQRGAVHARQHADLASVIGRTVSSARPSMRTLVFSTRVAHGLVFELAEFLRQIAGCSSRRLRRGRPATACTSFLIAEIASRRCSLSRTWKAWSSWLPTRFLQRGDQRVVLGRRLPVPRRLGAGFGGQLVDGVDRPSASRDGRTSPRRASRLRTAPWLRTRPSARRWRYRRRRARARNPSAR